MVPRHRAIGHAILPQRIVRRRRYLFAPDWKHVLHYRITGSSIEARTVETSLQRTRPIAEAAREFTEYEIMVRKKLDNTTLGIHTGAGICHSTQYVLGAEARA